LKSLKFLDCHCTQITEAEVYKFQGVVYCEVKGSVFWR